MFISSISLLALSHDLEGGEDLVLLVDNDHLRLPILVRSHELAIVARRDVARYIPTLIVMPSHKETTEQQVLTVKLGDIREFGEVDPIAVGKSSALNILVMWCPVED